MYRHGAAAAATSSLLLLTVLAIYARRIDHVTPELIVLCLADGLLGALAAHLHREHRAASVRTIPRPRVPHGENVIPLPVGLDPETAAAVRRINRRLASGG